MIDTPETKKPGTSVECGGKRATASMMRPGFTEPTDAERDGLEDTEGGAGRRVTLTTHPTQATFDRFGRLLAYVTTRAGTSLEATQLSRGWAKVFIFGGKPFQRVARFRAAERRAHAAGRGAWKLCGGNFHTPA